MPGDHRCPLPRTVAETPWTPSTSMLRARGGRAPQRDQPLDRLSGSPTSRGDLLTALGHRRGRHGHRDGVADGSRPDRSVALRPLRAGVSRATTGFPWGTRATASSWPTSCRPWCSRTPRPRTTSGPSSRPESSSASSTSSAAGWWGRLGGAVAAVLLLANSVVLLNLSRGLPGHHVRVASPCCAVYLALLARDRLLGGRGRDAPSAQRGSPARLGCRGARDDPVPLAAGGGDPVAARDPASRGLPRRAADPGVGRPRRGDQRHRLRRPPAEAAHPDRQRRTPGDDRDRRAVRGQHRREGRARSTSSRHPRPPCCRSAACGSSSPVWWPCSQWWCATGPSGCCRRP